jgi:ABC-type branched-subunit amino acid transport system ATPase component
LLNEGPLRQSCPVETANYLQSHGNNLPSFLLFLRNNYKDSYKRIVDYVRDVVPQFQDFYLEPVNNFVSLRWIDNSATDYRFNAYQFSDGSIRFIALAALLLQPTQTMPNVIILDEPELGLHPYAITQLAEMIKDASIHAQVIIATQSKDLVDHFDIDNVSVVDDADVMIADTVAAEDVYTYLGRILPPEEAAKISARVKAIEADVQMIYETFDAIKNMRNTSYLQLEPHFKQILTLSKSIDTHFQGLVKVAKDNCLSPNEQVEMYKFVLDMYRYQNKKLNEVRTIRFTKSAQKLQKYITSQIEKYLDEMSKL